jgi:hypothetical protein
MRSLSAARRTLHTKNTRLLAHPPVFPPDWIPLEFDAQGNVLPFAEFVDSFTLDVAEGFGTGHLNPRDDRLVGAPQASSDAPVERAPAALLEAVAAL